MTDRLGFPREMCRIVPAKSIGNVWIEHYKVTPFEVAMAAIQGDRYAHTDTSKTYTKLRVNGSIMMTDTDLERRTNYELLCRASGDVLIAGLGIGLILHPLAKNEAVRSITVLEILPEVIALVRPTIPKTVNVIEANVFDFMPPYKRCYDTIYFDIWPDRCADNLETMKLLHKRYRPYLRKGGYMESWYRKELRATR